MEGVCAGADTCKRLARVATGLGKPSAIWPIQLPNEERSTRDPPTVRSGKIGAELFPRVCAEIMLKQKDGTG